MGTPTHMSQRNARSTGSPIVVKPVKSRVSLVRFGEQKHPASMRQKWQQVLKTVFQPAVTHRS